MAFINKRTYEITRKLNEMYGTIPDDYFEVDELIALAISLLNKKGYETISSCSGHAFPERKALHQSENQTLSKLRSGLSFERTRMFNDIPYAESKDTFYILFRKEYDFFLDLDGFEGFELKTVRTINGNHSLLRKKYSAAEGSIEKMREIAKTMDFVTLWASEVDDISGSREKGTPVFPMNDLPLFMRFDFGTL